ncbi:MAG: hypothetical protein ACOC8F_06200, partial [Planctomycetota bacterium]
MMPFRRRKVRAARRWWQRVLRPAALVVVALAALYATLPWWAPRGVLRRWVAGEMSAQMGVPVEIDSLTLSWSRGMELGGLTIHAADGEGPLVVADAVRMDFSPVDLLRGRVAWMDVVRPRLFVRWDRAGRSSVAPLARLKFDVICRQISFTGAEALIHPPWAGEPLRLEVAALEVRPSGREQFGSVTMTARLVQPDGDAPLSFRATRRPAAPQASASVSLDFADVEMDRLGLIGALDLPLARLRGRCSGSVRLRLMRKTGLLDPVSVTLEIAQLDAQSLDGPDLPVIERAGVELTGTLDPLAETDRLRLDITEARVRLPGIDLSGEASVLAGTDVQLQRATARGTVDPQRLSAVLTDRPGAAGPMRLAGPVRIDKLALRRQGRVARLELEVDATQAVVRAAGRIRKPAGRRLRGRLSAVLDERRGQLRVAASRVELGDNWLEHEGSYAGVLAAADRLIAEGGPALSGVEVVRSAGRWHVGDVAALRDVWAALGPVRMSGPASGAWEYVGQPGGRGQFEIDLTVSPEARLAVGDRFVQPDGSELHLNASGRVVRRGDPGHDLDTDVHVEKLDLAAGPGRLHTDGLTLRVRTDAEATSVTTSGTGRFDVTAVESLLACVPQGVPEAGIRGSIPQGGRYVIGAVEGRVEGHVEVDLTSLDLVVGELLDKPDGSPGSLALSGTLARDGAGQAEAVLDLRPNGASGAA